MAAEDPGSADLLAVEREDWDRLVVRLGERYRVGELQGLESAKLWLTGQGIRWRPVTPAPRRGRADDHASAHHA